jgi:hypothetical protein
MNYYYSPSTSPIITMVSNTKNTMPCPFSGRYRLAGTTQALAALLEHDDSFASEQEREEQCHSVSVFMHAGCSDSSDLMIDSTCHPKPAEKKYYYAGSQSSRDAQMQADQPPQSLRTEYTCHGQWSEFNPTQSRMGSSGPVPQRTRVRVQPRHRVVIRSQQCSSCTTLTIPLPAVVVLTT